MMRRAKARGFSDVLYLDAETKKNIEEVSASNIFLVKVRREFFFKKQNNASFVM